MCEKLRCWRVRGQGCRAVACLYEPCAAVVKVLDESAIADRIQIASPNDLGGIDVGAVVDPFLEEVVTGLITDDGELGSGLLFQESLNTGALGIAGACVIPGHGPIGRHEESERLRADAKDDHGHAEHGNAAGEEKAGWIAVPSPYAKVAHALEHERIDQSRDGGSVMRIEPSVDREPCQEYGADDQQRPDAAVVEHGGKKEKRESEDGAEKEQPEGSGFADCVFGEAERRFGLHELGELPAGIELAHLRISVWRNGTRLLPKKDTGGRVLIAIDLVGHAERRSGDAGVIVAGSGAAEREHNGGGENGAKEDRLP